MQAQYALVQVSLPRVGSCHDPHAYRRAVRWLHVPAYIRHTLHCKHHLRVGAQPGGAQVSV